MEPSPNAIDRIVGKTLKQLRMRAGWEYELLATSIGIRRQEMLHIESGWRRLQPPEMMLAVSALNMSVHDLYADVGRTEEHWPSQGSIPH